MIYAHVGCWYLLCCFRQESYPFPPYQPDVRQTLASMIGQGWRETVALMPMAGVAPFAKMAGGVLGFGACGSYVNNVYVAALGVLSVAVVRYRSSVPASVVEILQDIPVSVPAGIEKMDKEGRALLLLRLVLGASDSKL